MPSRCDYCFDRPKGGCKKEGKCASCANADRCPRMPRPTIRITTKCTQECIHCCFSCSPKRNDSMSADTARDVAGFLSENGIRGANIMGGETWLNPAWREVLAALLEPLESARIVSNGDFMEGEPGFLPWLGRFGGKVSLAISNDGWHRKRDCGAIARAAESCGVRCVVDGAGDGRDRAEEIVPVGRGDMIFGGYSMFRTWCSNPAHGHAFMIGEDGGVFKCPFGIWRFGDVPWFLENGGFPEMFREVFGRFRKAFIPSCAVCARAWERLSRRAA